MMFSLVLLTALGQPAPQPAVPGGAPPQQMLASIAKGNLKITRITNTCPGGRSHERAVIVPMAKEAGSPVKVPWEVKVKVTEVRVLTVELPAKVVEAYTTDGKRIAADKLATLLAKERPVLVALDGKKIEPFLLQIYKEDTIVLVPPANTVPLGVGAYGTFYGDAPPPLKVPRDLPPPDNLKKAD